MFNMFEELFAPGRKHTNDERKRLELTRVDLNDADPGRGPIDLSSGKVVVRLPQHEPEPASAGEAGAGEEPVSERASTSEESVSERASTSEESVSEHDES
ncbi:DUF6191 domain-containing protein [Streptomyces sp. R41]|uniref:DUF6191 domain-containing protein n=1 Tax=Streptomyces sp. R41 TaxID=3238632 RepID=A0AB39RPU0_9ACTN